MKILAGILYKDIEFLTAHLLHATDTQSSLYAHDKDSCQNLKEG